MDTLYSLLDPLVIPLTWLLEMIHTTLGVSWGWSIVVLTVLVRIAMIPLTVKQQHSIANYVTTATPHLTACYVTCEAFTAMVVQPAAMDIVLVARPGLDNAVETQGYSWLVDEVTGLIERSVGSVAT